MRIRRAAVVGYRWKCYLASLFFSPKALWCAGLEGTNLGRLGGGEEMCQCYLRKHHLVLGCDDK